MRTHINIHINVKQCFLFQTLFINNWFMYTFYKVINNMCTHVHTDTHIQWVTHTHTHTHTHSLRTHMLIYWQACTQIHKFTHTTHTNAYIHTHSPCLYAHILASMHTNSHTLPKQFITFAFYYLCYRNCSWYLVNSILFNLVIDNDRGFIRSILL